MYTIGNVEVIKENGATTYRRSVAGAIIRFEPTIDQDVANSPVAFAITDHLGSTSVIRSDDPLMPSQHQYFQPFGGKMDLTVGGGLFSYWTDRSFTGHEEIESAGIIHMGGRIYDPQLGRFLQADPFVQAPDNSQSLNRYSYVINNPLSYTDSSGFFIDDLFTTAFRGIIVAAGCSVGGPIGCGVAATTSSIALGRSFEKSLIDGAIAGVQAVVFDHIGALKDAGSINSFEQILLHGAVGAGSAAAQSGDPLSGFLSSGLSKGFSLGAEGFLNGINNTAVEIVIMATVGGTISEITGGKFANGALNAGMGYAFNQQQLLNQDESDVLGLTLEEYLQAVKEGLWESATIIDGFTNNKEVSKAASNANSGKSVSDIDVVADPRFIEFLKGSARATARARIPVEGEKFMALAINQDGQAVVRRIAIFSGQGGSVGALAQGAGAIAHVHFRGLVQPPHGADHSAVKFANLSSFVIGSNGRRIWEVGRVNQEFMTCTVHGSSPGDWRKYRRN